MATTIDNRIVSMKFDNQQFEKGVGTTLNSLDSLKKGLDLSNSAKGFDSISAAAKRVSFDGMSSGIDAIRIKFSALQVIAVTALANIANSAINAGRNLISSLTVDPIKSGLQEYETKINAIQTILTNTQSKGTTLTQVNEALADLNTYADKTIYNFAEMTRNIGTFTAAGVDLKTSTESIKGIANLAAGSGSSAEQASTAMYQLSQAIAAGSVKLQDWNSVVNAGMGGELFQKALESTAKELGHGRNMAVSFRESLQDGWLTSEVLTKTLAKMAKDESLTKAATQVKTFTQLLDTMKESVQSGWAVSWESIIGNKEEAATMFTAVSDAFNSIVGSSSDARNAMLKFWHDNGGRDALIQAITNAFKALGSIIKPVSEAFKEIFPPMTGERLVAITTGLRDLTAQFKMSDATTANLKSTFKGLFAILDIGKSALEALFIGVKMIFGGVSDLGGGILGVTGSIGEWLVKMDEMIKSTHIFNKIVRTVVSVALEGFGGLREVFGGVALAIGGVLKALSDKFSIPGFEAFHSLLALMSRRLSDVGDSVGGLETGVSKSFSAMGAAVANSPFMKVLTGLWTMVKNVASGIGDLIVGMLEKFKQAFDSADFGSMFDAISGISIGAIALVISKFLKSLTTPLEGLKGLVDGVTGILDGVRGSFEAYQQNLKAGVLLKIAIAMGILSAAIVAISLIDSEKLASSLAAMGGLFAQLLVAMKLYSLIGAFKGSVVKSGVVMISMSVAILILASAMKKISELDWDALTRGMVGLAAMCAILVKSANTLSGNSGKMMKGSLGLIAFAAAIKIMADACVTLSSLSWEELSKGLVGVGALCAEISLFLNTAKFSSKSISTATGILILSAAIKVLASACKDFGSMSWEEIGKGLASVAALLLELSIFTKLTGNASNVISTGAALVIIAASMKIFASAMKDFGSLPFAEIAKGLIAMAGALTIITTALNFMPKNMIATGTGLVVVATALNIMTVALKNMGGMSWEEIAKGLTVLGGSLLILSVALIAMNNTIVGSAALIIAAGAIALLAPALSLLGAMGWDSIIKGLVALAGVFTILGVAALVLGPLVPVILGLSGALLLLSVSIIGLGVGLLAIGLGLTMVAGAFGLLATVTATGATAIVGALGIIITGIAALIPAILLQVGQGLLAVLQLFVDNIPNICSAVSTIVTNVISTLVSLVPQVVDGVMKLIIGVLDAIVTNGPTIVQKVLDIVISCLNVFANNMGGFVDAGVNVVVSFINGVANRMGDIVQAAFNLIIKFINGLADAIRNNSGAIADACGNLIQAIVQGIGNLMWKLVEVGGNIIKGIAKGIGQFAGSLVDTAIDVVGGAVDSVKHFLGIHSPSRVFMSIGRYSGEGMVIGLNKMGNKISDAATGLGANAVNSMSNAISGISDLVNTDIDSNPTIRPVLDLSNVQDGSKQLFKMMNNIDGSTINGSVGVANTTAGIIQYNKALGLNADNPGTANSNNNQTIHQENTFNINGSNPKEVAEEVSRILHKQVERTDAVWE